MSVFQGIALSIFLSFYLPVLTNRLGKLPYYTLYKIGFFTGRNDQVSDIVLSE